MNGFCLKGKYTCNEGFYSEDCSLKNNFSLKECSENYYANPDNVNEFTIQSLFFFLIVSLTTLNRSAEIPVQTVISRRKESVFLVTFHVRNALVHLALIARHVNFSHIS